MTNSACKQAILLPVEWHVRLAHDYPFGVSLKMFYDVFLAPLSLAEAQPYSDIYIWWRHASTCTASASAQACSGLQVSTTQLRLLPKLHGAHDGWAQEQAERILMPLHSVAHPLSSATFQTSMDQLHLDLAAPHAIREARVLAQHADHEAEEDHRNTMQTFEGLWDGKAGRDTASPGPDESR